jgi:hypothetical protein
MLWIYEIGNEVIGGSWENRHIPSVYYRSTYLLMKRAVHALCVERGTWTILIGLDLVPATLETYYLSLHKIL